MPPPPPPPPPHPPLAIADEDTPVESPFGTFQWGKYFTEVEEYIMSKKPTLLLNGKYYYRSILGTTDEEFGEYGMGVRLYFSISRIFIFLFFTLILFSLPLLIVNYKGNILTQGEINIFTDKFSIANIGTLPFLPSTLTPTEMKEAIRNRYVYLFNYKIPLADLTAVLAILDTYSMLFLIFSCIWLRRSYIRHIEKLSSAYQRRTKDFSLEITNLPRRIRNQKAYRDELKNYLNHVTQNGIKGVTLVRDYHEKINDIVKLEQQSAIGRAAYARALLGQGSPTELNQIQKEYERQKTAVIRFEDKESLDVLRAYVICDATDTRDSLLSLYRHNHTFLSYFQGKKLSFYNHSLLVSPAPEPTSIIWENLDTPASVKRKNRCLMWTFSIILIIASILVSLLLTVVTNNTTKDTTLNNTCANYFKGETISSSLFSCWETSLPSGFDKALTCYCSQFSLSSLASNRTVYDQCSDYFSQKTQAIAISTVSSLVIIVFNLIIRLILEYLVDYERPTSVSEKQKSITLKIFFALVINTFFLTLLLNANFGVSILFINGKFDDFTKEWYMKVGNWFVVTLCLQIVLNPLISMILVWVDRWRARRRLKGCVTREEKKKAVVPGNFLISNKIAQQLTTAFVVIALSSGIPFLLVIAFVTALINFFFDKFLFLRHSSSPPSYDETTYLKFTKYIQRFAIVHLLVSVWMYSHPMLFPSNALNSYVDNYFKDLTNIVDNLRRLDTFQPTPYFPDLSLHADISPNLSFPFPSLDSDLSPPIPSSILSVAPQCSPDQFPSSVAPWLTLTGFEALYEKLKQENEDVLLNKYKVSLWEGYGLLKSWSDLILRVSTTASFVPFIVIVAYLLFHVLRLLLFILLPSLKPLALLLECLLNIFLCLFCCCVSSPSQKEKFSKLLKKRPRRRILYDDFKTAMREEGKACNYRLDTHPNYINAFNHFKNAYNKGYDDGDEVDEPTNTPLSRRTTTTNNNAVFMVLNHRNTVVHN